MAYGHILVPFDDSPLAQAALSLGAWLAWRGGGEIDLVRAVPPARVPSLTRSLPERPDREIAQLARVKEELSREAQRLRETGVHATRGAFQGDPVEVLLDYVGRFEVDLVVMGTHGRPLTGRWLLGSVASEVARRSPVPVLLVPRKSRPVHDDALRVMVALDESAVAETALDAALKLGDTVPSEITLFEVLPGMGPSSEEKTPDWYEQPVLGASPYLDVVQDRLAAGGQHVRRAYSAGQPAEEIVLFAERGRFDVVAIGTRGLTGLTRLVWGSVADQVVRQAGIPVLVTSDRTGFLRLLGAVQPTSAVTIREPAVPSRMRYLGASRE